SLGNPGGGPVWAVWSLLGSVHEAMVARGKDHPTGPETSAMQSTMKNSLDEKKVSTGHLITGLHQCCSHNMVDVSGPTLQELLGNSYTQVGRKAGENGSTCIDCSSSVRDGHSTEPFSSCFSELKHEHGTSDLAGAVGAAA